MPDHEARSPSRPKRTRRLGNEQAQSKAFTRAALIKAASELFALQGLDAPSLDAICQRAGYTRGAFAVHFRNREELVLAVCVESRRSLLEQFTVYDDSPKALSNLLGRIFRAETKLPSHSVLHAVSRSPALATAFQATLREVIQATRNTTQSSQALASVRGDVDAEQLAAVILALSIGVRLLRDAGVQHDLDAVVHVLNRVVAG